MYFVSTRGDERVTGAEAIVQGLSKNGGLFVPETFPSVTKEEMEEMLSMSYPERAARIIGKYLDDFDKEWLLEACKSAYSKFEGDPAPLVRIDDGMYILELFHGPTCAFKDIALTLLPQLLRKSSDMLGIKEQILILTATSGDTGKAALEGFKDAEGVKIMVFYPQDGVSKMQKLQMCTQEGDNVCVLAVSGNFDDCQSAVKRIFSSEENKAKLKEKNVILSSANSINFGRLVPQIAYYFSAYLDLLSSNQISYGDPVDFAVPTGNFGDILAGYYAKKMGLPVGKLICASNKNKVLTDFIRTGVYNVDRPFHKTMSPSMDILISSNLERLLFEISGRNAELTAQRMASLAETGRYEITKEEGDAIREEFYAGFTREDKTVECVYDFFEEYGYPMDTHTGVAMNVAKEYIENKLVDDEIPMVVLSTASPYKFPQDVLYAVTGNDVKDSFKGIKRLHEYTAMEVPKNLLELRYKDIRFKGSSSPEKLFGEVMKFVELGTEGFLKTNSKKARE